ncbi:iron chelate uptake ABC transporter family permease subunit [Pectobacterium parmentieri]|uniref:Ferric enterobactin transport system permease protein FepG n=1 Tax=Pectobacterium parmentieri TaxID=1905730 RepID=A0A0H3I7H4_PECPM|nr:iron chelate uptake ABC transporter family permease subunit [Pectobacterium parmentieri]AFI91935.1 Ferric enterobactin transport system permease protein FepG [Pectobacterium parmentieri]AYH02869.1 iron-enterobactin ABC transporter permease [Pectobacterium parmentieri]AYH29129.1 iron-enterobactin ABC transporter permease [Pectobacterium parmentieri]AYH33546.1 iron-enterobactin ABC transporter permease [Pectobacterium parmentieri]MBI0469103.1 iron chelate uptake ABC transporter family permeas
MSHYARHRRAVYSQLPRHIVLINSLLLLLCLLLFALAVSLGALQLPPLDIWRIFMGSPSVGATVITEWRAPRALSALLLGAGLGVSGAIFQSISRNPLGSPDIIGFNTGAYTGALIVIILLQGNGYEIASGAMLGGIATAALVYLLIWRKGITGFRLILIGIAISAMLSAFNTWLIVTGSLENAMTAALWGTGSLNGVTWMKAQPAIILIPLTIIGTLLLRTRLKLLEMGDDSARSLGVNAEASRLWLMLFGILLTAVVTAVAGPISFIALAAPQIARRLTRASATPLFSAGTIGAVLLLSADIIAQHAFATIQLPVGAVTVSIGGVYLIWLLIREARR